MCKSLKVFHCSLPEGAEINVVRDFFAATPLQWEEISCVNWEQYPYRPEVSFAVAHNGTEMFIQYKVKETGIRAVYEKDEGSMPWTDSCVEFFLSPDPASPDYFNLEMNCIGHGLLAKGPDRHSRTGFPPEALAAIRRHSTLGCKSLSSADGEYEWTLTLAVPLSLYGI
ncbi:MAG: hypothetical protein HUJ91_01255, partial [Bacteroidales bacterium]|nr:hypothetical protein [Bacteroidales bacterium]